METSGNSAAPNCRISAMSDSGHGRSTVRLAKRPRGHRGGLRRRATAAARREASPIAAVANIADVFAGLRFAQDRKQSGAVAAAGTRAPPRAVAMLSPWDGTQKPGSWWADLLLSQ